MTTLSEKDVKRLAEYNSECARGLLHTKEVDDEMKERQAEFNKGGWWAETYIDTEPWWAKVTSWLTGSVMYTCKKRYN